MRALRRLFGEYICESYSDRSCLDNEELALLGVPWEHYRETANEVGLDVIR